MKKILFCITALIYFTSSFAQSTKQFGGYASNGQYIGFFQFLPEGYSSSGSTRYPLIISLHGAGEKGNGTTELSKVQCCGIPAYIKAGNKMRFTWNGKTESFIVLTPQLNAKYNTWQNFYVDELVKYALRSLRVDPDRIILTGLSLGGGGAWSYTSTSSENAHVFAGIVPVVAPCFIKDPCIIAKAGLPVFALHAMNDTVAPAICTINTVRRIDDCNPLTRPNVILYPTGGHLVFFNKTYDTVHRYQDPNVYEWMLAQNRKLPPNKKPIARISAGSSITNGKGLITLDGSGSYDPDGKLISNTWERISGPGASTIIPVLPGKAIVTGLSQPGTYTYLIKVVDDRAEWTTDTVSVTISSATSVNIPPVANAGKDIVVSLGQPVSLNASGSKDADGNIYAYLWSFLSGPSVPVISTPNAAITGIQKLQPGTYQFKLNIIDNKGAISTDVVQVSVAGTLSVADIPVAPSIENKSEPANNYVTGASDPIFRVVDTSEETVKASIFPNPVNTAFSIGLPFSITGNTIVRIYGLTGNLVRSINTNTLKNISVAGLVAGMYHVEILAAGHPSLHAQFIKK